MEMKDLLDKLEKQQATWDKLTEELKASRTLNEEQVKGLTAQLAESKTALETTKTEMEALKKRVDDAETKLNRRVDPAHVTRDHAERPFESFGEQLLAIMDAEKAGAKVDERLIALNTKAASGGSALVGADGAFLIQPDFASDILKRGEEMASLYSLCDKHQCSANSDSFIVPYVNETSRATGSRWGGVQVYRAGETDDVTAKKPVITTMKTELSDLRGLAYMTDRQMRDARAMTSIYKEAFASEFAWVIDNEILSGAGAGECLGVLNSPCLISVAKETGQAAASVVYDNFVKMRARLHPRYRSKAKWFYNIDIEPSLHKMEFPVGTGGVPAYLPAGGASATPFDRLLGLPMVPIEQAKTLGTIGDIILAFFGEYQIVEKGGLESAQSMHVRFINHENTFRWNRSINGQPKWKTTLTPANGSNTLSPFVALATRA